MEDRMDEAWVDIEGYGGFYAVSNLGKVKSLERTILRVDGVSLPLKERILKPAKQRNGYDYVVLQRYRKTKTKIVHRLVAKAFLRGEEKEQVNHKDGNKINNKASNLEWSTRKENSIHATRLGLAPSGEDRLDAKFSNEQVREIRRQYDSGVLGAYALSKRYNVNSKTMYNICKRVTWKHI